MTTALRDGARTWGLVRDTEGHREYKLTLRIYSDDPKDGPTTALLTPGLPLPGSYWIIDNDTDLWAWCRWDCELKPVVSNEPNTQWDASFQFSTKPPDTSANDRNSSACRDNQVEDPLLEPQKVSGSWVKYTRQTAVDRFGRAITTSSHEPVKGPEVEFDSNRDQVVIEQNVASLELPLVDSMRDSVCAFPLWGTPTARCVKLSGFNWEKRYYGNCFPYYMRRFTFDIDVNTFDVDIPDQGTKVLHGKWNTTTGVWDLINIAGSPPDPNNPGHFDQFKDKNGENCKVVLDGHGQPAAVPGEFVAINAGSGGTAPSTSPAFWQRLVRTDATQGLVVTNVWDPARSYKAGNLVTFVVPGAFDTIFVCTADNTGTTPSLSAATPWASLDFGLTYTGVWNSATSYAVGDIVTDLTVQHAVGRIHIEKYFGADYTLLRIPLTL